MAATFGYVLVNVIRSGVIIIFLGDIIMKRKFGILPSRKVAGTFWLITHSVSGSRQSIDMESEGLHLSII